MLEIASFGICYNFVYDKMISCALTLSSATGFAFIDAASILDAIVG